MKNLPQNERGLGHVNLFKYLEPVYVFGTVKCRNFVFVLTITSDYP